MQNKIIRITLLYLIVCCSYFLMLIEPNTFIVMTKEDALIENLGAMFYLLASIFFIYIYVKSIGFGNNWWKLKTNRNIFFLLLGIAFFGAFAEEISWGQRIFNWGTPEIISETNYQHETNIHNLNFFMYSGFSFERIFNFFWITYCFIIPFLNKYLTSARRFFKTMSLPIVPIWIGMLLLTNYILIHIIQHYHFYETREILLGGLEIKETNFAFTFCILAAYWVLKKPYKSE